MGDLNLFLGQRFYFILLFIFSYFFKFYFIFKFYNIVLVLPYINMDPPQDNYFIDFYQSIVALEDLNLEGSVFSSVK